MRRKRRLRFFSGRVGPYWLAERQHRDPKSGFAQRLSRHPRIAAIVARAGQHEYSGRRMLFQPLFCKAGDRIPRTLHERNVRLRDGERILKLADVTHVKQGRHGFSTVSVAVGSVSG